MAGFCNGAQPRNRYMEELKVRRDKEKEDGIVMGEIYKADQEKEAKDLNVELAKLWQKLHEAQAQPVLGPAAKVSKIQI